MSPAALRSERAEQATRSRSSVSRSPVLKACKVVFNALSLLSIFF